MTIFKPLFRLVSLSLVWIALTGTGTVDYIYDDKGRLKEVIYASGEKIVYSYDAAGNRTMQVITGAAEDGPNSGYGGVVVLPISGFVVIPLGNPDCSTLNGCS